MEDYKAYLLKNEHSRKKSKPKPTQTDCRSVNSIDTVQSALRGLRNKKYGCPQTKNVRNQPGKSPRSRQAPPSRDCSVNKSGKKKGDVVNRNESQAFTSPARAFRRPRSSSAGQRKRKIKSILKKCDSPAERVDGNPSTLKRKPFNFCDTRRKSLFKHESEEPLRSFSIDPKPGWYHSPGSQYASCCCCCHRDKQCTRSRPRVSEIGLLNDLNFGNSIDFTSSNRVPNSCSYLPRESGNQNYPKVQQDPSPFVSPRQLRDYYLRSGRAEYTSESGEALFSRLSNSASDRKLKDIKRQGYKNLRRKEFELLEKYKMTKHSPPTLIGRSYHSADRHPLNFRSRYVDNIYNPDEVKKTPNYSNNYDFGLHSSGLTAPYSLFQGDLPEYHYTRSLSSDNIQCRSYKPCENLDRVLQGRTGFNQRLKYASDCLNNAIIYNGIGNKYLQRRRKLELESKNRPEKFNSLYKFSGNVSTNKNLMHCPHFFRGKPRDFASLGNSSDVGSRWFRYTVPHSYDTNENKRNSEEPLTFCRNSLSSVNSGVLRKYSNAPSYSLNISNNFVRAPKSIPWKHLLSADAFLSMVNDSTADKVAAGTGDSTLNNSNRSKETLSDGENTAQKNLEGSLSFFNFTSTPNRNSKYKTPSCRAAQSLNSETVFNCELTKHQMAPTETYSPKEDDKYELAKGPSKNTSESTFQSKCSMSDCSCKHSERSSPLNILGSTSHHLPSTATEFSHRMEPYNFAPSSTNELIANAKHRLLNVSSSILKSTGHVQVREIS